MGWIKVDASTPDKPEILKLARMLGVKKNEALGLMVRFWIWADNASVDGHVDGVSSHEVDDVMSCSGFTRALHNIGWLRVDDENSRIEFPNFDRHNGETSKKRALTSARQAKWRNARVDASVTQDALPEKRREEKINTKAKSRAEPRKHCTQLAADWTLPEEWRSWAHLERPHWKAPDVERVSLLFRDHWRSKGEARADWEATWRNWVRRERINLNDVHGKQGVGVLSIHEKRAAVARSIFGDKLDGSDDITAESTRVA